MREWDIESVQEAVRNNPEAPALRDMLKKIEGGVGLPLARESSPNCRTNKYGVSAKPARTYNGITYHSKGEAEYAQELDLRKRAGEIDFWLRQVPVRLPGGTKYLLDFMTFKQIQNTPLFEIHYIEVKGMRVRLGEIKRRQTEELYGITVEVV